MLHLVIPLVQIFEHLQDALHRDLSRLSVPATARAIQLSREGNEFIQRSTQTLLFPAIQLRKKRLQNTCEVIPVIVDIREILPGEGIVEQFPLLLQSQHDAVSRVRVESLRPFSLLAARAE